MAALGKAGTLLLYSVPLVLITAIWRLSCAAGPIPFENLSRAAQGEFTLGGKVEVVSELYVDRVSSNPVWTSDIIERNIAAANERDPKTGPCTYMEACNSAFYEALEAHPVEGQNVLVVGSLDPWLEAICLSFLANSTTTVDFNPPKADDPRMRIWSIADLDASTEVFDAILSYSSLEHDGLGRYGDPMNPFGDLQRMRKLMGLIKPQGKLYLGVPNGPDFLFFNAHRIYGPIRFPMLIEGWHLLGTYGESLEDTYQAVFRSPPTCMPKPRESGPGCFAQPVHVLKLKQSA